MFSFRNPVQVVNKNPKNKYVLTLTKMEGDADHYYYDTLSYGDLGLGMAELLEVITILKAMKQGHCIVNLRRHPDLIGVSQKVVDDISDMIGCDQHGNRHSITEAVMVHYDEFGNKFDGDLYLGEEKIFPMHCW